MYKKLKETVKALLRPFLRRHAAIRRFPKSARVGIARDFTTGRYIRIDSSGTGITINIQPGVEFREFCNIVVHDKADRRSHCN